MIWPVASTTFHMNWLQTVVLSLLQGVSELFPISSLGHAVLLPAVLHWSSINETSDGWLAFLVALHLGTAAALLIYFWNDWRTVVGALLRSLQNREFARDADQRLAWMVIFGTVPAGAVGFILEKPFKSLFASPWVAASFLIVNGAIMFLGEAIISRQSRLAKAPHRTSTARNRDITRLGWRDATIVGFAQIGALVPGISRSGITMVAGLAAGLDREAAARYSFLLATPVILAAGLLEMPKLFHAAGHTVLTEAMVGVVLAAISAYLAVRFLMHYFDVGNRLYPFAIYCVGAGTLGLILLGTGL
jgi:undecaprenyl-diphosphatase